MQKEVVCFENSPVAWNEIAGCEQDHIARYQVFQTCLNRLIVPKYPHPHRYRLPQALCSLPGPVLLHEIQGDAHKDDGGDYGGADMIAGKSHNDARNEQDYDGGGSGTSLSTREAPLLFSLRVPCWARTGPDVLPLRRKIRLESWNRSARAALQSSAARRQSGL